MKNTNLPLLKFKCDNKHCQFECFINQNNNTLTAYNRDMATLMDWPCPECKVGNLRYGPTNAQFIFSLKKENRIIDNSTVYTNPNIKYIDPED